MRRKLYFILAAVLSCSLLVAGCLPFGGAEPELPVEEAVVLNLYGVDPYTLDPAVSGDATSHEYIVQIFGGLLRPGDDLSPAPDIARRWDVSDDGLVYTFHLRSDAVFHDGRSVDAGDFKYSWERACHPDTASQTAPAYLGDIMGVDEMLSGDAESISGVEVVDDYTLRVTIDEPKSYFLSKMTYPTSFVVDSDNVAEGGEWWRQPTAPGPIKLKSWEERDSLVLGRNGRYYGEVAGVDLVNFQLFGGIPMNMYELDEIDVAGVSISYIDKVTDERGRFFQDLSVVPELSFSYIGFNCAQPPFDDPDIRRAFTYAVDKDKLVSLVYRDMVQKADGVLPPGMPGFNAGLNGLDFRVSRAEMLIRGSQYGDVANLPSITLTTMGWGGNISGGLEAVISQWRDNLGVEVEVRQLEPELFLYHLAEEKDEMFYLGWVADYPHPQDFLDVLFRSGAENNHGEYSNPEVDTTLDLANVALEGDVSLALYGQVEQMLVDDAACLPLWFGKNYVLVKPHVQGYELNPMGYAMLNRVSILEQ